MLDMFKVSSRPQAILAVIAVLVVVGGAFVLNPTLLGHLAGPGPQQVVAWGDNAHGQLGTGTASRDLAAPAATLAQVEDIVQLAAGSNHGLALDRQGRVWSWGDNHYGQTATDVSTDSRPSPQIVAGLPRITRIAANQDHSAAVAADGTVWAWGLNISGQIGTGTNTPFEAQPKQVKDISDVKDVAAGYRTVLALKHDGSLWAWGGDCGLEKGSQSLRATVAELATEGSYADDSAQTGKSENRVFLVPQEDCINEDVVGVKSLRPKLIEGLPKLTAISAGFGHMLAIDESRQVWAWGCNSFGQVGNGTVGPGTGANRKPAKVAGLDNIESVSAGFRHSIARRSDGSLWAWGFNNSGSLGTGQIEDQNPLPAKIEGISNVTRISAGHDYTLAVTRDGRVWAWGTRQAGQYEGDDSSRLVPRTAWNLTKATNVIAGGGFALALVDRP